jgi:subtilisin family serine protease
LIAIHGDGDGDPGARTADRTVAAAGAQVAPLPAADAVAVAQPKASTADLWAQLTAATGAEARDADDPATLAAGVQALWLDGLRQPSLDVSVPQIGAPEAWAAGFTGAGVTVAVLDTGVDVTHPDLAGKVTASRNFTGEPDDDLLGHGTHVASTIVGSGAGSGAGPRRRRRGGCSRRRRIRRPRGRPPARQPRPN